MSMVSQELLDILVCPETKKPVALADAQTLASLNERIRGGKLRNRGGEKVEKELEEAMLMINFRRDETLLINYIKAHIRFL